MTIEHIPDHPGAAAGSDAAAARQAIPGPGSWQAACLSWGIGCRSCGRSAAAGDTARRGGSGGAGIGCRASPAGTAVGTSDCCHGTTRLMAGRSSQPEALNVCMLNVFCARSCLSQGALPVDRQQSDQNPSCDDNSALIMKQCRHYEDAF